MKIPKHKRFLYRYASDDNTCVRVGVIQKNELIAYIDRCDILDTLTEFKSIEKAFEHTFRYGSKFIKWIDTEWVRGIT